MLITLLGLEELKKVFSSCFPFIKGYRMSSFFTGIAVTKYLFASKISKP